MKLKAAKIKKYKDISQEDFYRFLAGCGWFMWQLEKLEGTGVYKKAFKMHAKALYELLDKQEAMICGIDKDSPDYPTAMEQMYDSYEYFENWFNMIFEIDKEKKADFSNMVSLIGSYFKGAELTPAEKNVMQMLKNVTAK